MWLSFSMIGVLLGILSAQQRHCCYNPRLEVHTAFSSRYLSMHCSLPAHLSCCCCTSECHVNRHQFVMLHAAIPVRAGACSRCTQSL